MPPVPAKEFRAWSRARSKRPACGGSSSLPPMTAASGCSPMARSMRRSQSCGKAQSSSAKTQTSPLACLQAAFSALERFFPACRRKRNRPAASSDASGGTLSQPSRQREIPRRGRYPHLRQGRKGGAQKRSAMADGKDDAVLCGHLDSLRVRVPAGADAPGQLGQIHDGEGARWRCRRPASRKRSSTWSGRRSRAKKNRKGTKARRTECRDRTVGRRRRMVLRA